MDPRFRLLLLAVAAVLFDAWFSPCQAQKAANAINDAYVKIKDARKKHVDIYAEELFAIADACAEKGVRDLAEKAIETILKLYEPPRNRRKIVGSAGVAAGGDGEATPEAAELKRVAQKGLSEEEKARLEAVKARIEEIRKKLPSAPAGTTSDGPEDKGLTGRLNAARTKFVREMVKLAQKCVDQGFPAHGYEVILWVLPFDPEDKNLRRVMSQAKHKTKDGTFEWYSAYEVQKVNQGYKLHPDYGWVTPAEIKMLDKDYLWFDKQKKWLPRDQVQTLRQKWENAWVYETEHYEISTNAPLRDAVSFGGELERFYRFFFRVFVDYYTDENKKPDPMLVFGGGLDLKARKLKLHYYASRESYLQEVKNDKELQKVPNIGLTAVSAGFYYPGNGRAYFYRGPEGPDLKTIYHEATHQVFGETASKGPRPTLWMVEGFGVFMEDPVMRGDAGSERLLAGAEPPPGVLRRQGESSQSVRDINDFVKNFQSDETFHGAGRGDNYATGGAVVHFLLLFNGGVYRRGFMKFAREAYRNNDVNTPTHIKKLYEYLGVTEEKLQADWEDFNKKPHLFDF